MLQDDGTMNMSETSLDAMLSDPPSACCLVQGACLFPSELCGQHQPHHHAWNPRDARCSAGGALCLGKEACNHENWFVLKSGTPRHIVSGLLGPNPVKRAVAGTKASLKTAGNLTGLVMRT